MVKRLRERSDVTGRSGVSLLAFYCDYELTEAMNDPKRPAASNECTVRDLVSSFAKLKRLHFVIRSRDAGPSVQGRNFLIPSYIALHQVDGSNSFGSRQI